MESQDRKLDRLKQNLARQIKNLQDRFSNLNRKMDRSERECRDGGDNDEVGKW
jgi:hypothetical protein